MSSTKQKVIGNKLTYYWSEQVFMMISVDTKLEPKDKSNTMMETVSNGNGNRSLPRDSNDKFNGNFGELEPKGKSNTMIEMVSNGNENESLPRESNDKFMHCATNREDGNFGEGTLNGVGIGKIPEGTEDIEINVTECTDSGMDRFAVAECEDATESSSSFGDTVSGAENDSAISDVEVESALCSGSPMGSMFDGLFRMRKRKLTDHWRRFIRPLMWRCKWLELKLTEFKSQALKYDKELAEHDQRKKVEYEKCTFEGHTVKSQPVPCQIQNKKAMKRRKRKRVEDTTDLASYMSHHNIFSYYDSKKVVGTASLDDDNGNLGNKMVNSNEDVGFNDGLSSLEFRDSDIWIEQILGKIDLIQSQVHKLKTRVDNLVNESPQKLSSVNILNSVSPCNTLAGSRSHSSPPGSGEKIRVTSQHLSGGDMADLLMPGSSAASSHGEVTPFPDMSEGNHQHVAAVSHDNIKDDILINNQAAKEELHDFQSGITQQAKEPLMPTEKPTVLTPRDGLPANTSVKPNVMSSSSSKVNKRKRGKRKSGTGWWSPRSSG